MFSPKSGKLGPIAFLFFTLIFYILVSGFWEIFMKNWLSGRRGTFNNFFSVQQEKVQKILRFSATPSRMSLYFYQQKRGSDFYLF